MTTPQPRFQDSVESLLNDFRLDGRIAIVTGAGRGIGRTIALSYAEAGADVVLAARTAPELDAVAKEVQALGRKALAVPTDVARSQQVDALVQRTMDAFGKVDIMVNNAGAFRELAVAPFPDKTLTPPRVGRSSAERMSDDEFHTVIETNIGGVFYGCRAVAPHMMAQRSGKIINISSIAAKQAYTLESVYQSTKAAVNMFTRCMALEWAPYNVCVNALAPGDYNTSLTAAAWDNPERRQGLLDTIPLRREGDMRNLGALAVYLASPASDYVTGQIIYVDGGITAK
ncbi:MAG: SDR family oxidoreductase [Chloroflexi bacterium]|nr:SDR family oxidoreductase [Chloroflexota bacterium]